MQLPPFVSAFRAKILFTSSPIVKETLPATIITSHCRGEKRITSAPNRAISKRDAAVAINSIAQQARPIGIGQSEFLRTQLKAALSWVKITLPSILESYAVAWLSGIAGNTNVANCPRKIDICAGSGVTPDFSQL